MTLLLGKYFLKIYNLGIDNRRVKSFNRWLLKNECYSF